MLRKTIVLLMLVVSVFVAGCTTVPMATEEEDSA
jgi:predicted small secreted protein